MEKPIIETINLSKVYRLKGKSEGMRALNDINIQINKGEIFGLLGPNGAGKTTFIQILTTILQPTSGYATIDGYNIQKYPKQAKSRIALMLDRHMLYYRMTAYDNLKFFCKIYKVPDYKEKIIKITKEFELENWLNQYIENFSTGMVMKIALCRTLLLEREILFLDEPTLGLDVKSIKFVVEKLKNLNKTIFITSHDMNVIDKLCDRIAYINKGNIVKMGSKRDIKKIELNEVKIDIEITKNNNLLKEELEQQSFIKSTEEFNEGYTILLTDRAFYKDLFLILSKYEIQKISEDELSLEDLFLKLT